MKTLIKLVATGLLVATMLSSCLSSQQGGSSISSEAEPQKIDLTYWTFNELHRSIYDFGEERYNQKYPQQPVSLSCVAYPNAEMHNRLLITIQSSMGVPDIADININYFSNFVKGEIPLVDLTEIVTPVLENAVKSRFDIFSKNGKYYGLPTHVGATVVYYNQEIMKRAGVAIDSIHTWDEYVSAGKQVVEKTGVPMTVFEVNDQRPFWPMILQQGGDYLNQDGTVAMDSEINLKTIQFMNKMMFEDKIAEVCPGGNTGSEEFWNFMNRGGTASIIMPSWYMSRFLNYMPDLKGKIFIRPLPVFQDGDARTVGIGGTATTILTQCKYQEIAKKVITEAKLTKEANINIWKSLSFDPVRTDVWDDEELNKPSAYFGNESFFDVIGPYKNNIPSPVNADLSAAAQDIVNSSVMYKVFVERVNAPEVILKIAASELRAQQ